MSNELANSQPKDIFSFDGGDMAANMKMAEMLAQSDLVPNDYKKKPANVIVAVQMGQEVGLKPMQALQNIAVINGRPCVWGDSLIGLVRGSGLCEYVEETLDETTMTAKCTAKRKDSSKPHTALFSLSDAKEAGLLNRSTWKQYQKRMLQMRARGFCLRDLFPDVLKGLHLAEEVQDYQPIKNINEAPTQSEKASQVSDFINSSKEVIDQEIVEEEYDTQAMIEKINATSSVQELSGLAVELGSAPESAKDILRKSYAEKNLQLQAAS